MSGSNSRESEQGRISMAYYRNIYNIFVYSVMHAKLSDCFGLFSDVFSLSFAQIR